MHQHSLIAVSGDEVQLADVIHALSRHDLCIMPTSATEEMRDAMRRMIKEGNSPSPIYDVLVGLSQRALIQNGSSTEDAAPMAGADSE